MRCRERWRASVTPDMGCRPHRAEAMARRSLGGFMLTAVPVVSKGRRRHQSRSRRTIGGSAVLPGAARSSRASIGSRLRGEAYPRRAQLRVYLGVVDRRRWRASAARMRSGPRLQQESAAQIGRILPAADHLDRHRPLDWRLERMEDRVEAAPPEQLGECVPPAERAPDQPGPGGALG
jgi:hypothetical protein